MRWSGVVIFEYGGGAGAVTTQNLAYSARGRSSGESQTPAEVSGGSPYPKGTEAVRAASAAVAKDGAGGNWTGLRGLGFGSPARV